MYRFNKGIQSSSKSRRRTRALKSDPQQPIKECLCCGSDKLKLAPILWQGLIDEWHLSSFEADYINRQQGLYCTVCGNNLRSMALALAIMRCHDFDGLFKDFVREKRIRKLRVLEINTSGMLTQFLNHIPAHKLCSYPKVDMLSLPYPRCSFDLVIHSDTLEHISDPILGLAECHRVIKAGGFCCFTVPIVIDRITRSRNGLSPSYHSSPGEPQSVNLVYTEYGSDAWRHVIEGGFDECRMHFLEFPSAQAFVGVKNS